MFNIYFKLFTYTCVNQLINIFIFQEIFIYNINLSILQQSYVYIFVLIEKLFICITLSHNCSYFIILFYIEKFLKKIFILKNILANNILYYQFFISIIITYF